MKSMAHFRGEMSFLLKSPNSRLCWSSYKFLMCRFYSRTSKDKSSRWIRSSNSRNSSCACLRTIVRTSSSQSKTTEEPAAGPGIEAPPQDPSKSRTEWHESPFGKTVPAAAPETGVGEAKKVTRKPFVKELFVGRLDMEALAYPEVLNREKKGKLDERINMYQSLLTTPEGQNDSEFLFKRLKELGAYGQRLSQDSGTATDTHTEYTRALETIGENYLVAAGLANHNSCSLKGVWKNGSALLRSKYFPKLRSGESVLGMLLFEPRGGPQVSTISAKAVYNANDDMYYVNGVKRLMVTSPRPNAYVFLALTQVIDDHTGLDEDKPTAFLIDATSPGIKVDETNEDAMFYGHKTLNVTFENTPVSPQHVLKDAGDGIETITDILQDNRIAVSAIALNLFQRVVNWSVSHAVHHSMSGYPLKDLELVQERLAVAAQYGYVAESMLYFTTGMLDLNEHPDTGLETAIVRVFSSEMAYHCVDSIIRILSYSVPSSNRHQYEQYFQQARSLMFHEENNDLLKIYIGLTGLQYAGKELRDHIMKLRNPLLNPSYMLKTRINRIRQVKDKPKLNLDLKHYVHPSLQNEANLVEYLIARMGFVSELLLHRWGQEITHRHMEVHRVADIIIHLYSMLASLSRANRSYCIGLPHAQVEMQLVSNYIRSTHYRLRHVIEKCLEGEIENVDVGKRKLAKKLLTYEGYCLSSPLDHNP